ncbi:MAG: hypothetical protein M3423_07740, partial [Actinomycetota bacterium]|nr:hypothetical protein [Actinomycetota bacterium]
MVSTGSTDGGLVSTGSTDGEHLPFEIPAGLLAFSERGEDWAAWLDALPRLVRDIVAEWELTYDGQPMHGFGALVVPVRSRPFDRLRTPPARPA